VFEFKFYFIWISHPGENILGWTHKKPPCQNHRNVGPNLRSKFSFIYTLVYLIGLGGLHFPHLCMHSWKIMNTQKPIICINWFLNCFWLFSFKYSYTYTLDIFSCLFSTCTREWFKLVIRILTKCENSYHLCSWHQWPFRTSQS